MGLRCNLKELKNDYNWINSRIKKINPKEKELKRL